MTTRWWWCAHFNGDLKLLQSGESWCRVSFKICILAGCIHVPMLCVETTNAVHSHFTRTRRQMSEQPACSADWGSNRVFKWHQSNFHPQCLNKISAVNQSHQRRCTAGILFWGSFTAEMKDPSPSQSWIVKEFPRDAQDSEYWILVADYSQVSKTLPPCRWKNKASRSRSVNTSCCSELLSSSITTQNTANTHIPPFEAGRLSPWLQKNRSSTLRQKTEMCV